MTVALAFHDGDDEDKKRKKKVSPKNKNDRISVKHTCGHTLSYPNKDFIKPTELAKKICCRCEEDEV